MKDGEIACVVGRVIGVEPFALASCDLQALSQCDPPVQRFKVESISYRCAIRLKIPGHRVNVSNGDVQELSALYFFRYCYSLKTVTVPFFPKA